MRQISVVNQCKLKRIGDLKFYMMYGACGQRDNSEIFICFPDAKTSRSCYSSTGPLETFSPLKGTYYPHGEAGIAVTSSKLYSYLKKQVQNKCIMIYNL